MAINKFVNLDDLGRFASAFKESYNRLHPDTPFQGPSSLENTIVAIGQNYNYEVGSGTDETFDAYVTRVDIPAIVRLGLKGYEMIQKDFDYNGKYTHDLASVSLNDIYDELEEMVSSYDLQPINEILIKQRLNMIAAAIYYTYGPENTSYILIRSLLFDGEKKSRNLMTAMEELREKKSLNRRQARCVDACITYMHNNYYNQNWKEYDSSWCNILRAIVDNITTKFFIVNYDEINEVISSKGDKKIKF